MAFWRPKWAINEFSPRRRSRLSARGLQQLHQMCRPREKVPFGQCTAGDNETRGAHYNLSVVLTNLDSRGEHRWGWAPEKKMKRMKNAFNCWFYGKNERDRQKNVYKIKLFAVRPSRWSREWSSTSFFWGLANRHKRKWSTRTRK